MLAAALEVNNPLAAAPVPASATGVLPSSMSIASTNDARALVTVAKVGTVIAVRDHDGGAGVTLPCL
jgi:hypothetical protein